MLALHVVGQDLESGRRVHLRPLREQHVPIVLGGVGSLRLRLDLDLPMEHTPGIVGREAPIVLPARHSRRLVREDSVDVADLRALSHEHTSQIRRAALTVHCHVDLGTRPGRARLEQGVVQGRVRADRG